MATKTTLLDSVNVILSNIGQAPVTNLDTPNPMVNLAVGMIQEVSRAVQAEGWVFNTEDEYPLPRDINNEILIADNVLQMDLSRFTRFDVVLRSGKLYDKTNHTYKFEQDLKAFITWIFPFDEIPEAFKNYITIRAANLFAARVVGSQEVVKYSQQEETIARSAMIEYETQQGDYNMLGDRNGRNVVTGYMPIDTIYRY